MDVLSTAVAQNTKMTNAAISTLVLRKAMGVDAQSLAGILEMAPQMQQLAVPAGGMDIKV